MNQTVRRAPDDRRRVVVSEDTTPSRIDEGDLARLVHTVHAITHRSEDTGKPLTLGLDGFSVAHRAAHGGDTRQKQLLDLVLEHAVNGAGVQTFLNDVFLVGAGENRSGDAGGRRIVAQPAAELVAIPAGHEVIDDGDVEAPQARQLQRLGHVGRGLDAVAVARQQMLVALADGSGVVHQQQTDVVTPRLRRFGCDGRGEQPVETDGALHMVVPQQQRGAWPPRSPVERRRIGGVRHDEHRDIARLATLEFGQHRLRRRMFVRGRTENHGGKIRRGRARKLQQTGVKGGGLDQLEVRARGQTAAQ